MASLQPSETDKEENINDSTTPGTSLNESQTMDLSQGHHQVSLQEAQSPKTYNNRFYDEMKKEIEKLRQCCRLYEETIQDLLNAQSELEDQIKKAEGNCDTELIDKYKLKLSKMETEISAKNKQINSLENTIQKNKNIISVMWEDLKKCKVIIEDLEQEERRFKQKYEGKCENDDEIVKTSGVNLLITQFTKESPVTGSQNDQLDTIKDPQIEQCLEEIATQKKLIQKLKNEISEMQAIQENCDQTIHTQAQQLIKKEEDLKVFKSYHDKEIARRAQQLRDKIKHHNLVQREQAQQIADQSELIHEEANKRVMIEKKYKEEIEKLKERENIHKEQIAIQAKQLTEAAKKQNIEHEYKEQIAKLNEAAKKHEIIEQEYKEKITNQSKQLKETAKEHDITEQKYKEKIANQSKQLKEAAKEHSIIEQKYKEQITLQAKQLKDAAKEHSTIQHEYIHQITKLREAAKVHDINEQKYKEQIAHQANQLNEATREYNSIKHEYEEQITKFKETAMEHSITEQKYKEQIASQLLKLAEAEVDMNVAERVQTAQINEIAKLKEINQELTVKLEFYESENKRDYENHQAIVNQLLGTLHLSQEELKSQAHMSYKLRCAVRCTMASNSQLTEELKQLSARLEEKVSLLNTSNKELENVTKQLEESNKELENVMKQLEEQICKTNDLEKKELETDDANKKLTQTIRKLREDIDIQEKTKQILEQTLERERSEKMSNETFIGNLLFEWSKMLQQPNIDFPLLNLEAKLLLFDEMLSKVCMASQEAPLTIVDDSMSSTSSTKNASVSYIPTEFDETNLVQDEASNNTYGENSEINRNASKLSLEFQFDDTFPLTNTILSALNIHDDNLISTLSLEEREELFNKIISQISTEKTIERVKLCKQQCKSQYIRFHYLIKDISVRLRDHKCIGASASVNSVFILLEDLRLLLQEIMHSSCYLGTLMSEETTVQQWNFLRDYVRSIQALHRKDLVNKKVGTEHIEANVKIEPLESTKTNKYRWYGCAIIAIFALLFAYYWQSQRSEDELMFTINDFKDAQNRN